MRPMSVGTWRYIYYLPFDVERNCFKRLPSVEYNSSNSHIPFFLELNHHQFTQFVWWSVTHIGCARAFVPQDNQQYNYFICCNYGSTQGKVSKVFASPVYQRGKACSACAYDKPCSVSSKYPSLCGGGMINDVPFPIAKHVSLADESFRRGTLFGISSGSIVLTTYVVFCMPCIYFIF